MRIPIEQRKPPRHRPHLDYPSDAITPEQRAHAIPQGDLVLAVRFLYGWCQIEKGRDKCPLSVSVVRFAKHVLGIRLNKKRQWYLPRGYGLRLFLAGISSHDWKVFDQKKFNLAVWQILTTGRFVMAVQKRLIASGFIAPEFTNLVPKRDKKRAADAISDEIKEMSRAQFSERVIEHFFE